MNRIHRDGRGRVTVVSDDVVDPEPVTDVDEADEVDEQPEG